MKAGSTVTLTRRYINVDDSGIVGHVIGKSRMARPIVCTNMPLSSEVTTDCMSQRYHHLILV